MAQTPDPPIGARIQDPRVAQPWNPKEVEEVLFEPYEYITQVPGKDIRTMLIMAFNKWLKIPEDKLELVKEITKLLHNASLLVDDIQDNSKLRRGIPVAHSVYGVATTINSANYVYFHCLQKVTELGDPKAVQVFTEQLLELHRGQGMDIYWRDAVVVPSESQYRAMVKRKTGGLFGLAVMLMQLYSDCKVDFSNLLDILGLHFQIRDDYANLMSDEYAQNKSFAEDFTEGKFSFPIIHSILSTPQNHQVINILRQRTDDTELKKFAVDCIERTGSFKYTRSVLLDLEAEGLAEIKKLGGNDILVGLFDKLSKLYKDADALDKSGSGSEAASTK
eukprot:m.188291 g.188291  ORF g.188291 m.188291 type:complete len:334 (-) comp18524_c0_seq3:320-1321(-)